MSKTFNRSPAVQIEHWTRIKKIAKENPDLNYDFIKNILIAQEEAEAGKLTDYHFDEK